MLIDTDHPDAVEPVRVIDQPPAAFGEDSTVRGVPGHPETGSDAGHGEVVDDDPFECPAETAAGDLGSRRRGLAGVFSPDLPAVLTPIPTHPDQQRRGPVPEWLVREPAGHCVPHDALGTALATPRIRLDNAALDNRPIRLQDLTDGLETELVEAAERGEAGRGEGSVEHVEVFRRTVSVRTSILEDLDTSTGQRRAAPTYTLNYEEPV